MPPAVVATTFDAPNVASLATVMVAEVEVAPGDTTAFLPPTVNVAPVKLAPVTVIVEPRPPLDALKLVISGPTFEYAAVLVAVPAAFVRTMSCALPTGTPFGTVTEIAVAFGAGVPRTDVLIPPIVTDGLDVATGDATASKLVPLMTRVSPALPDEALTVVIDGVLPNGFEA